MRVEGILELKDHEMFLGTPESDRVFHVAVFCKNIDQARDLMEACQPETEGVGKRFVAVHEPLREVLTRELPISNQFEQQSSLMPAISTFHDTNLNRICQKAWEAYSRGSNGLSLLVNYIEATHQDPPTDLVGQIARTERLVNRFLPEYSFGFPLSRFCFYLLPDFCTLDLKELILAHRQILFPEKSDSWIHTLTTGLIGRLKHPLSVSSAGENILQSHVAMTALGAPRTRFKFLLPTGEVQLIARNLREFVEILPTLSQDTFNFHLLRWVYTSLDGIPFDKPKLRSDFSLWIAYGLHDCPLAMDIFELAYSRTQGQGDLSELSIFGQQMLRQSVTKICANRLTFLESYLTKVLGETPLRKKEAACQAYLLVNTKDLNICELSSKIATVPGVRSIFRVEGPYQILIKLHETTVETLRAAIQAIRGLQGVATTLTLPEDEKVFQV
jgi:hypothetical protein